MTPEQLLDYLNTRTELCIDLTVTDNRRSMISSKWTGERALNLRVHKMFLDASPHVLRSLASFLKRPTKSNREVIGKYINENLERLKPGARKKLPPAKCVTAGKVYDLEQIFTQLNRKYFKSRCDSALTWGNKPNGRRRTHIRLGSYDYETNTIRIHPALDRSFVPDYVVETILFHEMLHWYLPPEKKGGRLNVHTRPFKMAEKQHPKYESAQKWRDKNLIRLLRG